MKNCIKCELPKPLSEFYRHSEMSDGHLNKCKVCCKKDSNSHRVTNLESVKAYDRERGRTATHKKRVSDYYQTEKGKLISFAAKKRWQEKNKEKRKAHTKVQTALRNGSLVKLPCEKCGNPESEAHHEDYSFPLDVNWLCSEHHAELHRLQREEERKAA